MTTTREQLIDGLRMVVREGLRTTRDYGPDDWQYLVHDEDGGWTVKKVYAHLAASAESMPGLISMMQQAPADQNPLAGFDLDAFNAQGIAAKEELGEAEVMTKFQEAFEKLAEFIKGLPDEQLQQVRRVGQITAPGVDLLQNIMVLHGMSHVYHAQFRPLS
jgi:hypothetical protein